MLTGKGFFISEIQQCEKGDPADIALRAGRADLSHVIIKIADRTTPINQHPIQPVAWALRDARIQVWGWQFVTGDDPRGEARTAIQQIKELKLDGFVICAEDAYEEAGKAAAAQAYMAALRASLPALPTAFSSYRFPSYHPRIPWREFLNYCDYNMPKVFWVQAHNPKTQLERSFNEFDALRPTRPVIPVGAAYATSSWQPTPGEIKNFLLAAQELNLSAVNFWDWDSARSGAIAHAWDEVKNHPWLITALPDEMLENYLHTLNAKDPAQMVGLYAERGVHVTAERTIRGAAKIRAWYDELFARILPDTDFEMISYRGMGNVRHLHWRAVSVPQAMAAPPVVPAEILDAGYTQLFQGVFYRKVCHSSPREYTAHIALIDLADPEIDLVVTPRVALGRTTSKFLRQYGLQLAVNGDEWLAVDDPKGLAACEGDVYSAASVEPTVFISPDNEVQIGGPSGEVWNAISGSHTLVIDGAVNPKLLTCRKPEYCEILAPRTALGITAKNFLVLVVAEGPPLKLRAALSLKELAELLVGLGVRQGISFDGGGSSTMVHEQHDSSRVVNMPSDGRERVVANHMGIRAAKLISDVSRPLAEGRDTLGYMGEKIVYHLSLFA